MKKVFPDNSVFLFQGDSVTDCHRIRFNKASMGTGYPKMFKDVYCTLFPNSSVKFVNRGVSGDRTCNLLERYNEDFLKIKPDFISILIGINNTWRNFDSNKPHCTAEQFGKEYEQLLTQIKRDLPNTKILIIEQFAFTAHPTCSSWQEDLDAKRAETCRLADKYADWFIPLYDIMKEASESEFDLYDLSKDGVHPEAQGHALIAAEIFKALNIL